MNYIDLTVRCLSFSIFVMYFLLVIFLRELRRSNLFYVHHANFINMIYVLIYLSFFNSTVPTLGSAFWNDFFCRFVEILFGFLKFQRSYSVLLIAFYRVTAVYAINFHKKINKTNLNIMLPVLLSWILSLVLALATKFAFNTSYSSSLCVDGYSIYLFEIINYLATTSVVSITLPFVLTMVFYFMIKKKLEKNSSLSSITTDKKAKQNRKEQRFSTQLIAINTCYIVSFSIAFVQTFRYIIPDFNTRLYYLRQSLRTLNLSSVAVLPIISIYFNPMITFRNMRFTTVSKSAGLSLSQAKTITSATPSQFKK